MINEFYELSQTKNNGEGSEEKFSASLKTGSTTKMDLRITKGNTTTGVSLTHDQVTMLLKLFKMVKQNHQINRE